MVVRRAGQELIRVGGGDLTAHGIDVVDKDLDLQCDVARELRGVAAWDDDRNSGVAGFIRPFLAPFEHAIGALAGSGYALPGSFTTPSQNRSMALITARNSSRSPGFVR